MYKLRNKKNCNQYWSETIRQWTNSDNASLFYSEDDVYQSICDLSSEDIAMSDCVLEKIDDKKLNISLIKRCVENNKYCDPDCPFMLVNSGIDADCGLLNRYINEGDFQISICSDLIEDQN